jgi:hypothetical protein
MRAVRQVRGKMVWMMGHLSMPKAVKCSVCGDFPVTEGNSVNNGLNPNKGALKEGWVCFSPYSAGDNLLFALAARNNLWQYDASKCLSNTKRSSMSSTRLKPDLNSGLSHKKKDRL